MASLNRALLIGNLGKDPEVRFMPNGDAVCNFSIATTESYKDKNGDKQEKSEWLNITMYRKLAEIAGQYLKKGSQVYLEGKIQTRKWQDKEGKDRYTTEIVCDEMKMLGGKPEGQQQQQAPRQAAPAPARRAPSPVDEFEDDIPFN